MTGPCIFLTGATGLLGGAALKRLLDERQALRAYVLVRDRRGWLAAAERVRIASERVEPVSGDLRRPGLGLERASRARLAREVDAVLHLAGDITFSRPLGELRAVNVEGTRRVLELADSCPSVREFGFVSTAFVAGRRMGRILENELEHDAGWVNGYEQSKWEAERLVRAARPDAVVFRSSTVVCDTAAGEVSQYNAVHRALRLYHSGLAPMMPGRAESTVDLVPVDFVTGAIAALALDGAAAGRTLHLCAGEGAIALGELLDICFAVWSRAPQWRWRGIERPALTDLRTYRLFEESVEETADPRLRQVTRSLSHFVPQLALEKRFDTSGAAAALGHTAPPVRAYWARVVEHLVATRWAAAQRQAA